MDISLTAASLIASFLIAYLFYFLQRRHSQSATTERLARAKAEIVEVLEQNVVGKRILTEETINALLLASEREHQVNLREVCSPLSLLQDVSFRLQRSPHLDVQQKSKFQELLDGAMAGFSMKGKNTASLGVRLEQLREAAIKGDTTAVDKEISKLKETLQGVGKREDAPDVVLIVGATLSLLCAAFIIIQAVPLFVGAGKNPFIIIPALAIMTSFPALFLVSWIQSIWTQHVLLKRADSPNPGPQADA